MRTMACTTGMSLYVMESASSWPMPGSEKASSTSTVDPKREPRIRPALVTMGRAAPLRYMRVVLRSDRPRERAKST